MKHNYNDNTLQAAIDAACDYIARENAPSCGCIAIDKRILQGTWIGETTTRLDLARALLDLLPEPTPPVVDGKTPAQVFYEAFNPLNPWYKTTLGYQQDIARGTSAVLTTFSNRSLSAAIARMEAVPWKELDKSWDKASAAELPAPSLAACFEAVRARLIAAAKEGQAEAVDWKAKYEETLNTLENFKASHETWIKETEWVQESKLGQVGQHRIHAINEYIKDLKARSEKAEAELAKLEEANAILKSQVDNADVNLEQMKLIWNTKPQLRPLSEAGDVPDGCLRYYYLKMSNKKWSVGTLERNEKDTHFADIGLPEKQAEEIPWIEWHGGECPLNDDEVEEWEYRLRDGFIMPRDKSPKPTTCYWLHDDIGAVLDGNEIIAYRVLKRKTDPYAALKKAHADGKVIQMKLKDEPRDFWEDITNPGWGGDPNEYRIKPTPETFEAHGKVWTRHAPGDPMPCDGEAKVDLLRKDREDFSNIACSCGVWDWIDPTIIAWRYADETPAIATLAQDQIDLTPEQQSAVDVVLNEELGISPIKANPVQDMALGGQMYWRDLARQLAEVWWKCHGIGASLQHGDIDTDVNFTVVCEQHGGQCFHADTPHNAWLKAEKWLMSPDRAIFKPTEDEQ